MQALTNHQLAWNTDFSGEACDQAYYLTKVASTLGWREVENSVQVREAGKAYKTGIYVGEDLAVCRDQDILKSATLRVVMKGLQKGEVLEVALNDQALAMVDANRDGMTIRFELSGRLPKLGINQVSVIARNFASEMRPTVTLVELLTEFNITGVSTSAANSRDRRK